MEFGQRAVFSALFYMTGLFHEENKSKKIALFQEGLRVYTNSQPLFLFYQLYEIIYIPIEVYYIHTQEV